MNPKHTIAQSDWWNYPVLQAGEYSTPFRYTGKDQTTVEINVGLQDGIPVMGYSWHINGESPGCGGGGCSPGRKWGEFPTLRDAELYALRGILERFRQAAKESKTTAKKTAPAIKALQSRISALTRPQQLELPF